MDDNLKIRKSGKENLKWVWKCKVYYVVVHYRLWKIDKEKQVGIRKFDASDIKIMCLSYVRSFLRTFLHT